MGWSCDLNVIDSYINYMTENKYISTNDKTNLKYIIEYLEDNNKDIIDLADIDTLYDFIVKQSDKFVAGTVLRRLDTIRNLLLWCRSNSIVTDFEMNIDAKLTLSKIKKAYYAKECINGIYRYCIDITNKTSYVTAREKMSLLLVILDSLPIEVVCNVNTQYIFDSDGIRLIPNHRKLIATYLNLREKYLNNYRIADNSKLFIFGSGSVTYNSIHKMYSELRRKLPMLNNITLESLRAINPQHSINFK